MNAAPINSEIQCVRGRHAGDMEDIWRSLKGGAGNLAAHGLLCLMPAFAVNILGSGCANCRKLEAAAREAAAAAGSG